MNQANRDDFFTLIQKGLRRELFAVTILAGTIDWADPDDVESFETDGVSCATCSRSTLRTKTTTSSPAR